jgi:hypothetical protein
MVRAQIAKGALLDAVCTDKCTAAHYASCQGNVDCLTALSAAGAKLDLTDQDGEAPVRTLPWPNELCWRIASPSVIMGGILDPISVRMQQSWVNGRGLPGQPLTRIPLFANCLCVQLDVAEDAKTKAAIKKLLKA